MRCGTARCTQRATRMRNGPILTQPQVRVPRLRRRNDANFFFPRSYTPRWSSKYLLGQVSVKSVSPQQGQRIYKQVILLGVSCPSAAVVRCKITERLRAGLDQTVIVCTNRARNDGHCSARSGSGAVLLIKTSLAPPRQPMSLRYTERTEKSKWVGRSLYFAQPWGRRWFSSDVPLNRYSGLTVPTFLPDISHIYFVGGLSIPSCHCLLPLAIITCKMSLQTVHW